MGAVFTALQLVGKYRFTVIRLVTKLIITLYLSLRA
jgi:hypothetical protein